MDGAEPKEGLTPEPTPTAAAQPVPEAFSAEERFDADREAPAKPERVEGPYDWGDPLEDKPIVKHDDPAEENEPDSGEEHRGAPADDPLAIRAQELGIEPGLFSSPEAMRAALDAIDGHLASAARKQEQPQPQTQPQPHVPSPEQWAEFIKYKLQFGDDVELDDKVVDQLNKMNDHYAGHVDQLHRVVHALVSRNQQQEAQSLQQRFDGYISELGDDWKDVLGQGPGHSLSGKSSAMENRIKVLERMDVMARGYAQSGRSVPTERELFQAALMAAHGSHSAEIAKRKLTADVSKRKSQAISRPTHRNGTESRLSPEEAARKWARQWARDRGLDEVTEDVF